MCVCVSNENSQMKIPVRHQIIIIIRTIQTTAQLKLGRIT